MTRHLKRLPCVILSLLLMFQLAQPAFAWQQKDEPAAKPSTSQEVVLTDAEGNEVRTDDSWNETYPYGAFAFDKTAADVQEGDDTVITVYRLGGTKGRATAYISYSPILTPNEDGSTYYGYALSGKDLTIEVEDTAPIAQYQPVGKPADPEKGTAKIEKNTDEQGYVLRLSQEADSYQWEIFYNDTWCVIRDSDHPTLEMDTGYLDNGQDYRCVYTVDGVRYCTDSLNGAVYEKPAPEELAPMPDDIELNPAHQYLPLPLDDEDDPYSGWVFELTFAEGEWAKEIHFHANRDDVAEAMEGATLRIAYTDGGDICKGSDTLFYHVEDMNESTPGTVGFTVQSVDADKADGTVEIMVRREGGTESAVSVDYTTVDGGAKAGTDYVAASGTLMFYGNVTELPVKVELIDNKTPSDTSLSFSIKLSELKGDDKCTMTADTATVTLTNSGKGDASNLASQLYDEETVDLSKAVKDSPTSANSGSQPATGEQLAIETEEAPVVEIVPVESTAELSTQSHDFGKQKALLKFTGLHPSDWRENSVNFGSFNPDEETRHMNFSLPSSVQYLDGAVNLITGTDDEYYKPEEREGWEVLDYYIYYYCYGGKGSDYAATLNNQIMSNWNTYVDYEKKYAAQMFENYEFSATAVWENSGVPKATYKVNTGTDYEITYDSTGPFGSLNDGNHGNTGDYYWHSLATLSDGTAALSGPFLEATEENMDKPLGGIDATLTISTYGDGGSEAMIRPSGTLSNRRSFQENAFYMDITTPNDGPGEGNVSNVQDNWATVSDYSAYYPVVTLDAGSVAYENYSRDNNKLYVGSTIRFSPNSALAGMSVQTVAVLASTDNGQSWHEFDKFRIRQDGNSTLVQLIGFYSGLTLNDINNTIYKFRVVYARDNKLQVNLNPSLPRNEDGNPLSGQMSQQFNDYNGKEDHCFGDAKITWGYSRFNDFIGYVNLKPYEYYYNSFCEGGPITPELSNVSAEGMWTFPGYYATRNIQWINFGLPKEDLLVVNGKMYAGNETIYLTEQDFTGTLTILYYHPAYQGCINPMTTIPAWAGIYFDANGNGKIDGQFNDQGLFVLDTDPTTHKEIDEFVQYISGGESFNELEFSPTKLKGGNYCQYFIQVCYTMTPRCLIVPTGEDPDGKAQILPAFTSAINPDSAAYAALTPEQKQYTYVKSGKIGPDGNDRYTSDNHPMYGKEASARSILSIPMGGDKHPPEAHEDGSYTWQPVWFQNQLYTYEHPELVTIENSVAGETPVTTHYDTDSATQEYIYDADGLKQINGYLASFTGTSTYVLVSRMQQYTTEQILSGAMSTQADDKTDDDKPDSVTMGFIQTTPDGTYLAVAGGSKSNKPESIDSNGGDEKKNELPEFGKKFDINLGSNEINATDYVTILLGDNEIGFSIAIPIVEGEKNHRNEHMEPKIFTPFTDPEAWTQFKSFFSEYGNDNSLRSAFAKKHNANNHDKTLQCGKFSAKLAIRTAFLWRYNPLDNKYIFAKWELGVAGELEFRGQARLTACPLLYGFFDVKFSMDIKSGVGIMRDATDGTPIIDGKKKGGEKNAKELAHYSKDYTGSKGTPEFCEFDLNTKAFNVRFKGKLYVQVMVKDGSGWKEADKSSGFVKGLITSDGTNDTLVVIKQQNEMALKNPVKIRLIAANYDKNEQIDKTTVSYLAPVKDVYSLVHWNGINLAPELAIEVGGGVGVELAKLELYIHFSIGVEVTFCNLKSDFDPDIDPHTYDGMYDPADINSFEVNIGLAIRAVFLFFTYELDLVSYQISYDGGKDEWEYGWHFFNDMLKKDGADDADAGVTIRLPQITADSQQLYTPADNARSELITQAFTPNDPFVPFQLSGYGSSMDAVSLSKNISSGSQYKVLQAGDKSYIAYTLSRTADAPEDSTMLVLSRLGYDETAQTYGLVSPTGGGSLYIPLDTESTPTGDLDFDLWADESGTIHAAWVSYAKPADPAVSFDGQKPEGPAYTAGGVTMNGDNYKDIPAPEDAESEAYANWEAWYTYYDALSSYNAQMQARAKTAAENTVVKTASWKEGDAAFSAPEILSNTTGKYVFLPDSQGSGSAIFFGSTAAKDFGNRTYNAYVNYQNTKTLPAEVINYLTATRKAAIDMLGTQSALNLAVRGNTGWRVYQTVLKPNETLANAEFTQIGDAYYVAYTTEQTLYTGGDMATVYRLYLRNVTLTNGTARWSDPCLIRELRDYDQNKGGTDGVYSGGALMEGKAYEGPYLSNLRFLNSKLDSSLLTGGEELSVQDATLQTILVFEMNGSSYIIPEDTLRSIVTDGTGMLYPFFTPPKHVNADDSVVEEASSGKLQVDINTDRDNNLYAVYVGNVDAAPGNALFMSCYDAETGTWGDGVILAMRDMDTYEAANRNGWDHNTTELAYLYGSSDISSSEDALTALYGQEALDAVKAANPAELGSGKSFRFSELQTVQGAKGELLVVTQGSLQPLAVETYQDNNKTKHALVPAYADGTMDNTLGTYAIAFGKGAQKLGSGSIGFGTMDFGAGSELYVEIKAMNVGTSAFRGSEAQPITATLTAGTQKIAAWEIKENVVSGQEIQLDGFCTPLKENLENGDTFTLTLAEYTGEGYTGISKDLILFTVGEKPDLCLEDVSIRPSAITDDGRNTVMDVSFLATNQGAADADNVYVQFTYVDENGKKNVLPLTDSTLTVDNASAISDMMNTQDASASDLDNGILTLESEDESTGIPMGYVKKVSGTITVPSGIFAAGESRYADISIELFSDADSVPDSDAGVLTANHDEYYSENNTATRTVEAYTEFTAPYAVVIPMGTTTMIPISAVSSRGTSPVIIVEEKDDTSDGLNIGILNFKKSGGTGGTANGVLSLTPLTEGGGTVHITDTQTNSSFSITFKVSGSTEGIDIYNDNKAFTFKDESTKWQFRNINSWGEGDAAEAPLRNNLSVGSRGAEFTFSTVAESIDLYFKGNISVQIDGGTAAEYTNTTGGKTPTKITIGTNPDNVSRTVKITVLNEQTMFDRMVESYTGGVVPKPVYDGTSPYFIWSRNFPATGSVADGTPVPLKVYALDNNAISSLTIGTDQYTDPAVTGDPVTSETPGLWCYDFGETITKNGDYVITARDDAGNQTSYTLQVDWFLPSPTGDANSVPVPLYDSRFCQGDTSISPTDSFSSADGLNIQFTEETGNPKAENNTHEVFYFDGSDFQAVTENSGTFPITSNGIYWTRTVNDDGTWSADVLVMSQLSGSAPQATLGYDSARAALVWTAKKASQAASISPITDVTINGYKVNEETGTDLSGTLPISYSGAYVLTATDASTPAQSATVTYNAVLPLQGEKVTAAPVWSQTKDNGAVILDVKDMTGETYGSASDPASGSYAPGSFETALTTGAYDPNAADLAWTTLQNGAESACTWDGLAPGTYTVVIRDKANPDNFITTDIEVADAVLTASATTMNSSNATATDGKIILTTDGGASDRVEFAVIPAANVTDIQEALRSNDVTWVLGDENGAGTVDNLGKGSYYVAARSVLADVSSLGLDVLQAAAETAQTTLDEAKAALEQANADLKADPENPQLQEAAAAAQTAVDEAQSTADTAQKAYDDALAALSAASQEYYQNHPESWDGVFVISEPVEVKANSNSVNPPIGPVGPVDDPDASNLQDISVDKNGSVVFTLKPNTKLTPADQEKLRKANASDNTVVISDGTTVMVPEGTLTTPDFDANRLIAKAAEAKDGMVVEYTDTNGETKVDAFSIVNDGKAYYIAIAEGDYRVAAADASFNDISGLWGEEDILFAAYRQLVNGTGNGNFSPALTMSRAMFVTVLWRMSASPKPAGETTFQDLDADWYMEAVAWAVENDIVNGYSPTSFGPNDPVTREQMCVLMIRYLDSLGWKLDLTKPAISFGDADKISDWAKDAVNSCTRMGLINGTDNNMVAPQKDATRMEASTVLARFVRAIVGQYCMG